MNLKNANNQTSVLAKESVFIISLIISLLVIIASMFFADQFLSECNVLLKLLVDNFGWFYLLGVSIVVIAIIYLFFSKYGDIKLGSDDSKPEFSYFSWIAMLFAAGMGIGLVFWGTAEPLSIYFNPPPGITPQSTSSMEFAMKASFFHWGVHPWCIYSILGVILAYVQFRKKEKGLISRVFVPIFGRKLIKGWLGKAIDISTVVATVAGLITSLGLGTLQISRGLHYVYGVPLNNLLIFGIVFIITILYITSAVCGLDKGIKNLSNFNIILAVILLITVITVGPTVPIFNAFTNVLGDYLSNFIQLSLRIDTFGSNSWTAKWTIFMWATWVAWAPFVATFIARVSKGRTIKEFIIAVVLVPSLIGFIWFSAFGILGINVADKVGIDAVKDPALTLFMVLRHYPFGNLISLLAILLLTTFFITSADSAVFVLGILTSNGNLNPKTYKKVIWGIIISTLAFLILRAGGIELIMAISIIGAFPFLVFMLIAIMAILRHFYLDRKVVRKKFIQRMIYEETQLRDIGNIGQTEEQGSEN